VGSPYWVLQCGQHRPSLYRQDVIRSAVSTATKRSLYTWRPCRMVAVWNVVWVGLLDIVCISCVLSVSHGEWGLHIRHYAIIRKILHIFLCKSFHQFPIYSSTIKTTQVQQMTALLNIKHLLLDLQLLVWFEKKKKKKESNHSNRGISSRPSKAYATLRNTHIGTSNFRHVINTRSRKCST